MSGAPTRKYSVKRRSSIAIAMQNLKLLSSGKQGEGTETGGGVQAEEDKEAEVGEGTSVETEAGAETSIGTEEDTGAGARVTRQNSLSSKMSGLSRSVSLRMSRNACLVSDLQIDKDGMESALVRHWQDKNVQVSSWKHKVGRLTFHALIFPPSPSFTTSLCYSRLAS